MHTATVIPLPIAASPQVPTIAVPPVQEEQLADAERAALREQIKRMLVEQDAVLVAHY